MAKPRIVAAKVKGLKNAGIDVGDGGVLGADGVFYYSERDARIAAAKYKKKVLRINGPEVSGWLVLTRQS